MLEPRYNGREFGGTARMTIQIDQPAPNVTLANSEGNEVSLAELGRSRPVVVAFLRHFG